jgi:hypothetical protein
MSDVKEEAMEKCHSVLKNSEVGKCLGILSHSQENSVAGVKKEQIGEIARD